MNTIIVSRVSPEARALIEQYQNRLKERLDSSRFKPSWNSIEEMLERKYGVTNVNEAYKAIDFRNKTVFLDKNGNDITASHLTYQQADWIIESAMNVPLD